MIEFIRLSLFRGLFCHGCVLINLFSVLINEFENATHI